jgi:hypothetical protein
VEGPKGTEGADASAQTAKSRKRLLKAVDRHIENIYGELTNQLNRIAKIQAQVDDLRDKVRRIISN